MTPEKSTRQRTVVIGNPYRLVRSSAFVELYRLANREWPRPFASLPFRRLRLLLHVIASLWGSLKVQRRRGRLLRAAVTSAGGDRYFTIEDSNSQFHSIYFSCYEFGYEPEVEAAIAIFLMPGGYFLDIGANWGHYTFLAASDITRAVKVYCFEPSRKVFADLWRIRTELGLQDSVKPYNLALSDQKGQVELRHEFFESGLASAHAREAGNAAVSRPDRLKRKIYRVLGIRAVTETVECVPLDSLPIDGCDLMKIDAEGAELSILRGARAAIELYQPVIVFEHWYHDEAGFTGYRSFFREMGYEIWKPEVLSSREPAGGVTIAQLSLVEPVLQAGRNYNLFALPQSKDPAEFGLATSSVAFGERRG